MASWSLLTAVSGFEYDGPAGRLGFAPRLRPERFKALFTAAEGWGTFAQQVEANRHRVTIEVSAGALSLRTLELAPVSRVRPRTVSVRVDRRETDATLEVNGRLRIRFERALRLREGARLELELT
jgi:hypothetical protein